MLFKPMSEKDFERWVRQEGFFVKRTSGEWQVVDSEGKCIYCFAVKHGKGKKREVKACYVKSFEKVLNQLGSKCYE